MVLSGIGIEVGIEVGKTQPYILSLISATVIAQKCWKWVPNFNVFIFPFHCCWLPRFDSAYFNLGNMDHHSNAKRQVASISRKIWLLDKIGGISLPEPHLHFNYFMNDVCIYICLYVRI